MRVAFAAVAAVSLVCAAPVAADPSARPKAATGKDKLICKRWTDTGSLVARVRACHTRADWDRIMDSQQQGARKVQEGLTTRPNCNLGC